MLKRDYIIYLFVVGHKSHGNTLLAIIIVFLPIFQAYLNPLTFCGMPSLIL